MIKEFVESEPNVFDIRDKFVEFTANEAKVAEIPDVVNIGNIAIMTGKKRVFT